MPLFISSRDCVGGQLVDSSNTNVEVTSHGIRYVGGWVAKMVKNVHISEAAYMK